MANTITIPTITVGQITSPFLSPTSWDQINIAGSVWGAPLTQAFGQLDGVGSGGTLEIEGAARFYRIDQKNNVGQDGAIQTYRGKKPIVFKLIFKMWTDAQWSYWITFSKVLQPEVALDVFHPSLALLGINAIMIKSVGAVKKMGDSLMFHSVCEVHEYLKPPPVNKTATPAGALIIPPITIGAPFRPLNPLAVQRDALAKQVAANATTSSGLPNVNPP